MNRVEVSEQVLRWALDRSSLSEPQLTGRFPRINEWLLGTARPTLRQLERLAKTTRTPLGYFFLDEPPVESLPVPHFRTLNDEISNQPSPDLLETVYTMQRRQAWMRESLIEKGQEPLWFVGSAQVGESPRKIAMNMRLVLGFDEDWAASHTTWSEALRTLRAAIDEAGILVVTNGIVGNNTHRRLSPDEFRGFVLVDDYAPLLFVNGRDAKAAQMFTLAHELAHLFFGKSAAFDLRGMHPADDPVEQACNTVAAEFLVSEGKLRSIWPSVREEADPLQRIAQEFKVSVLVAARRALDLSLITRDEFRDFYDRYLDNEHRKPEDRTGGNFYANQDNRVGRRFALEIVNSVAEGRLLYTEAYELTGLYGATFEEYVSRLGTGGVQL